MHAKQDTFFLTILQLLACKIQVVISLHYIPIHMGVCQPYYYPYCPRHFINLVVEDAQCYYILKRSFDMKNHKELSHVLQRWMF